MNALIAISHLAPYVKQRIVLARLIDALRANLAANGCDMAFIGKWSLASRKWGTGIANTDMHMALAGLRFRLSDGIMSP